MRRNDQAPAGNFTTGPLADRILLFALPIAASSILQQCFNAADTAVVGRFAGSAALAAVGSNSSLTAFFVTILTGLSVGSNVCIAQAVGSGEREEISAVVHTSVLFSILSGIAMALLGIPLAGSILKLMGCPEDVITQAALYLRIYLLGMPFIVLYNFGAAILRAVGDTRRPMYCLAAAGVINVMLNLVMVVGFHMDVAGVAIATVASNVVSSLLVLRLLFREKGDIRFVPSHLGIDLHVLKRILVIGGPSSLQGAAFSLSNVCIQSGINSLGTATVAAASVTGNIECMDYYLVSSYNQAAMTLTGQNYGAGKLDRCRRILKLSLLEALGTVLIWEAAVFLLRGQILGIFTADPEVIAIANEKLLYCVLPHFMICGYELLASSMRGMGHSLRPAVISVCGTVAFRMAWVFGVFPHIGTLGGLCIVYFLSWILTNILMSAAWLRVMRAEDRAVSAK